MARFTKGEVTSFRIYLGKAMMKQLKGFRSFREQIYMIKQSPAVQTSKVFMGMFSGLKSKDLQF